MEAKGIQPITDVFNELDASVSFSFGSLEV